MGPFLAQNYTALDETPDNLSFPIKIPIKSPDITIKFPHLHGKFKLK